MKLLRYRVTDFRSVEDSGWIDCDDVTTLVGINESGKSNLLWECKIVCVKRNCTNLLYAPYWGNQS